MIGAKLHAIRNESADHDQLHCSHKRLSSMLFMLYAWASAYQNRDGKARLLELSRSDGDQTDQAADSGPKIAHRRLP